MKKPNYGFEKHRKEMKRKKEQEEKMRRKLENAKRDEAAVNPSAAPSAAPIAPTNTFQVTDSGDAPKQ